MGIQSMGMGSGLDVQLIIDELVNFEESPKQKRIDEKAQSSTAKISALGDLKSALSNLQAAADKIKSSEDLISYSNNSSSLSGVHITSTSSARNGSYTLNVSQLALAQKTQLAAVSDNHSLSAGSLTFTTGGSSHEISWSAEASLTDVRQLINQDSASTGVQATIVSTDIGDSLILTSTDVGTDSAFSITGTGGGLDLLDYQKASKELSNTLSHGDVIFNVDGTDYTLTIDSTNDSINTLSTTLSNFFSNAGLSIEASLKNNQVYFNSSGSFSLQDASGILFDDVSSPIEQSLAAMASQSSQDLIATIDNLQVTSKSNILTDAIEGLTLEITQASSEDQVISVSKDISQVSKNIQDFVNELNQTTVLIDGLINNTQASQGAFASNSIIRGINSQFRNIMSSFSNDNSISTIYDLGIEFDRYSKSYKVDTTKLESTINVNFDELISFFGDSTSGIGTQFYDYLDDTLGRTGFLATMDKTLKDALSSVLTDQIKLDQHIERYRERLVKQYTAMDTTVAQLQSTGEFLSQWADSMNNSNKK